MSNGVITIPQTGQTGSLAGAFGFAGNNSFQQKLIETTFSLAAPGSGLQPGAFAATGARNLTISGARTSVRVAFAGGMVGAEADVSIWGLSQSQMNELQTLGQALQLIPRNVLTVAAGDATVGLSVVFTGNIIQAWGDYNSAPDVAIRFHCAAGVFEGAAPMVSTTFTKPTSAVTLLSQIASQKSWGFLNNGVSPNDQSVIISNPYFHGSAIDQVRDICEAAHIYHTLLPGSSIGGQQYTLAIYPRTGPTPPPGSQVPLISPATGLIGYPTFAPNSSIFFKTLYNPQIAMGGFVNIQSSLFTSQVLSNPLINNPTSNWYVMRVDHALDSLVPKGEWSSTVYATVAATAAASPVLPPS